MSWPLWHYDGWVGSPVVPGVDFPGPARPDWRAVRVAALLMESCFAFRPGQGPAALLLRGSPPGVITVCWMFPESLESRSVPGTNTGIDSSQGGSMARFIGESALRTVRYESLYQIPAAGRPLRTTVKLRTIGKMHRWVLPTHGIQGGTLYPNWQEGCATRKKDTYRYRVSMVGRLSRTLRRAGRLSLPESLCLGRGSCSLVYPVPSTTPSPCSMPSLVWPPWMEGVGVDSAVGPGGLGTRRGLSRCGRSGRPGLRRLRVLRCPLGLPFGLDAGFRQGLASPWELIHLSPRSSRSGRRSSRLLAGCPRNNVLSEYRRYYRTLFTITASVRAKTIWYTGY